MGQSLNNYPVMGFKLTTSQLLISYCTHKHRTPTHLHTMTVDKYALNIEVQQFILYNFFEIISQVLLFVLNVSEMEQHHLQ